MLKKCTSLHISKSKCTKHHMFTPLLEVRMLKKCTSLWREAHFEVKMYKTPHVRATFGVSDVEKVHVVVARSIFRSQTAENTPASDHFWRFGCCNACRCGVEMYETLGVRGSDHFWSFRCRFASLHYTTLHYTTLHYTTLHYTTLHYTTLHYIPLHSTTLHYIALHYITLNDTAPQIDR